MKAHETIDIVKKETDKVILFHSATGKDSIALLDLLSPHFEKIVCVFMYYVKNLNYEHRYINWATKKYPNAEFIEAPHFAVTSFVKHGYLGIKKDSSVKDRTLKDITKQIKQSTGLDWAFFGFKKIDSIDRRIMLNGLPDGISHSTKNAYPLADYKNSQVLEHINRRNLIPPFCYNKAKPSSGCDISDPTFLAYMKQKYPDDLKKIFNTYPYTEAILFRYENKTE
jgi:3'-phosphoadenosine 5'-phosphosulfate sulfotransferase (PAPS reductase)/FAD synthetase